MRRPSLHNERGSTLVLVVLLSLVLSASAIVALRDVARTTQAAGVYRTRAQAQLTSDSANRLFGDWVGLKAATLIDAAYKGTYGEESAGDDLFGGGSAVGTAVSASERRRRAAIIGAQLRFNYDDFWDDCGGGCTPLIDDPGIAGETGLFTLADGESSFETRRQAVWRVKLRDLADGFPAIGYSGEFCFKKALVAAEARVGEVDADWGRSNNVAQSRHGTDAMIGPIKCGYN